MTTFDYSDPSVSSACAGRERCVTIAVTPRRRAHREPKGRPAAQSPEAEVSAGSVAEPLCRNQNHDGIYMVVCLATAGFTLALFW